MIHTTIEEEIPSGISGSMEEIGKEKSSETGRPWITIGIDLKESATPETRGGNPFACVSVLVRFQFSLFLSVVLIFIVPFTFL